MQPNPYESPRPGEPREEKAIFPSDPTLRLLTEIRDLQREALEQSREAFQLSRDTLERQRKYRAFPIFMMVVALGFLSFSMYRLVMTPRPPMPRPARTVTSPAPLPVTASPPARP
jgi:hypothetical protein